MKCNKKVILASGSPRRSALLNELEIDFEKRLKEVDESYPEIVVKEMVPEYLARLKAEQYEVAGDELLITADTIVLFEGKILGKPKDSDDAVNMLSSLSAKAHSVITGVCLRFDNEINSFSDRSEVYFKDISPEEIQYYINHFQPFDKAGSYGIQEWWGHAFIDKIEGSYTNIMGLPTGKLYDHLKPFLKFEA